MKIHPNRQRDKLGWSHNLPKLVDVNITMAQQLHLHTAARTPQWDRQQQLHPVSLTEFYAYIMLMNTVLKHFVSMWQLPHWYNVIRDHFLHKTKIYQDSRKGWQLAEHSDLQRSNVAVCAESITLGAIKLAAITHSHSTIQTHLND